MSVKEMTTGENGERKIVVEDFDLAHIARRWGCTIRVWVPGFWSDCINVSVGRKIDWIEAQRDPDGRRPHRWTFEVSHSSGGRDAKDIEDSIETEEWFVRGLQEAVNVAKILRSRESVLEELCSAHEREIETRDAEERAAREAAVSADPAITKSEAQNFVTLLAINLKIAAAEQFKTYIGCVWARHRGKLEEEIGSSETIVFGAKRSYARTTFYVDGQTISKARAVELLQERAAAGAKLSSISQL